MRIAFHLFCICVLLFYSCRERSAEKITAHPIPKVAVMKTQGDPPSKDSMRAPVIVPLSNPQIVMAGEPTIVPVDPNKGEAGGRGVMQNFTADQGLALDFVTFGVMDRKGNLWFGTEGGGASCYNGKSFTNYTTAQGLPSNFVNAIVEDSKGNSWFCTRGKGVACYNGRSFNYYTKADGLPHDGVWGCMEDRNGNMWFSTDAGVARFDGKNFRCYSAKDGLAGTSVGNITEDSKGRIWFCSSRGGVSCYDGKTFVRYTVAQGLPTDKVFCITEDKNGNLWFGTNGSGLVCFDGKKFSTYTTEQGLASNMVINVTLDSKGNLWIATYGGGVSRYDGKKRIGLKGENIYFTTFAAAQGLINGNVFSITEDRSGNLWFGTQGDGVFRYDGSAFSHYTTAQGLANNIVASITEDKRGVLWFAAHGGLSRFDGRSFANFTEKQGLAYNYLNCIMTDSKGQVWIGTQGRGLSCYRELSGLETTMLQEKNHGVFVNYTMDCGLPGNLIWSLLEDKKGNIWIGTAKKGVSKFDGKTFTQYTTAQGLCANNVFSLLEDKKGNIWMGTTGGLTKYDGKQFTHYTTKHGLADDFINTLMEDKNGNIWIGTTSGGVSRFDGSSFLNFTTEQGLTDNCVMEITTDAAGSIFMGTNMGLTVLSDFASDVLGDSVPAINSLGNAALATYRPTVKIYNYATGYPIKNFQGGQNGMYRDSKGILWIGTGSEKTALIRFDYKALHRTTKAPEVIIQHIKVNKQHIPWYTLGNARYDSITIAQQEAMVFGKQLWGEQKDSIRKQMKNVKFDSIRKFHPLPENLKLAYDHNNVSFTYAGIETSRGFLVKYQYILEGYDKDWSPVTDKTEVFYGNIYEGNYTFKVKARGPDGLWSEPVSYRFKVLPPWWRTWWMYSLYGLLLIALIASIVWANGLRLRRKAAELADQVQKATREIKTQQEQLKEQQMRELELIAIRAQMNPHFLFNVLASIQAMINKSDVFSANIALAKFGKLMRLILENSERQSIVLKDELEMLHLYIDLESMLLSFKHTISVNPQLNVDEITIPSMIIQPYVENAIKHGIVGLESGRELLISFDKKGASLLCSVRDNGIGRKKSAEVKSNFAKHRSMGTRLTSDRLKLIAKQVSANVAVNIKDLVDSNGNAAGTLVDIHLPMQEEG